MRAPLGPGMANPLLIPLEIQKNPKQDLRETYLHLVFTAVKRWRNPSVPGRMADTGILVHLCSGILRSLEKGGCSDTCYSTGVP